MTIRKCSLQLITFALLSGQVVTTQVFADNEPSPARRVVQCVSKKVWDAGFVFYFDLNSCQAGTEMTVLSDLYEIVTMWTPERVYLGTLKLVRLYDTQMHFKLVDRLEQPTVEIDFILVPPDLRVEVLKIKGVEATKYATLECDPILMNMISAGCSE
jgi:hypothetical protein